MAKRKRVSREAQYPVIISEARIESERVEKFLGSAKVNIDLLRFESIETRRQDDRNEDRLLNAFQQAGCLRLDRKYHVQAKIDKNALLEALRTAGSSTAALFSDDASQWPRLEFPANFQVECLHGQHRVCAGMKYLWKSDRWWVVDFYSHDLSAELRASLIMQTLNEKTLSAGQIYFHILRCEESETELMDWWWAQIQSSYEQRALKKLYERAPLNSAFRKLAQIPALSPDMLAGNVEDLLALKCDEEIIRYLSYVYDFWISLFEHDADALLKIRYQDVKQLEGRNPGNCLSDRQHLLDIWPTGAVFGDFSAWHRERLWARLQVYRRRIPSLFLFFQDYKYFESLVESVKKIVPPVRRKPMRQVLRDSFREGRHEGDTGPKEFDRAYRKLYLSAMRHAKGLNPKSIRLEANEQRALTEEDAHTYYEFAAEARRLGFSSKNITARLINDPDREEARRSLMRARNPKDFSYVDAELEAHIDQIASIYATARRKETMNPEPCLVSDVGGEEVKRRFGYPPTRAFKQSAQLLSLENMHILDTGKIGELTSFFVRRDVYLAFFGPLGDDANHVQESQTFLKSIAGPGFSDSGATVSNSLTPLGHDHTIDFPSTATLDEHQPEASSEVASRNTLDDHKPEDVSPSPSSYSFFSTVEHVDLL